VAPAAKAPPARRGREGSGAAANAPLPSEQVADSESGGGTDDSNSSAAGAILLGLLAGGLLFACGLGARRGWMRWRYGL
jgi:hypothetical protein